MPLRELLVNEGLAVEAARAVSPGHADWEYFGYARRQYARIRELESIIARGIVTNLGNSGLGLRLRYLSSGLNDDARTVDQYVLPERSGYYVGSRMVERAILERGLPWSIRAAASELLAVASAAPATA